MKNKISAFALVIVVAIPQLVSASWWNPTTWLTKPVPVKDKTEIVNATSTVKSATSPVTPTVSEKPKVVEKIVTQVIKVDNPELQAKIDALVKQNADLNLQMSSYISRLNECKEQLVSKPSSTQSPVPNSNISLKITNGSDLKITEVEPSVISQQQLKSEDKIQLTVRGINFQNSPEQHEGKNKPPLVRISSNNGASSVDTYDGTSLTFTIPKNSVPDVKSDPQGNVYTSFTFTIYRQRIGPECLGCHTVDSGAQASFMIPIL